MSLKDRRELRQLKKVDKSFKTKSHIKSNLPTIIVLTILFFIFFTINIINHIDSIDFNINDLIYKINVNEKLTSPFDENDLSTAKEKLANAGLTNLANKYIITELENNSQTPTSSIQFTNAELASVLAPIYYAKYGKTITVYEIELKKVNGAITIKTTSGFVFSLTKFKIDFSETLYITEYFEIDQNGKLIQTSYQFLNTSPDFSYDEESTNDNDENSILEFLNYVFIGENCETYIQQLNYNSFDVINDMIEFRL